MTSKWMAVVRCFVDQDHGHLMKAGLSLFFGLVTLMRNTVTCTTYSFSVHFFLQCFTPNRNGSAADSNSLLSLLPSKRSRATVPLFRFLIVSYPVRLPPTISSTVYRAFTNIFYLCSFKKLGMQMKQEKQSRKYFTFVLIWCAICATPHS